MGLFARKVELYDFSYGVAHFRYANGVRAVSWQSQQYDPAALDRGAIHAGSDPSRNTLDITAPLSLPLLDLFRPVGTLQRIGLTLYRQNVNGSTAAIWNGEIGSVEFAGDKATIHCLPPLAALNSLGLKRAWQKSCPHVLYGAGLGQCNASRTAVQTSATLTGVAGDVINAAAFAAQADGWWAGGYIEWDDGTVVQRRFISSHAADAVTLLTPAAPLVVGDVVTALPGCDHTLATCNSKFANAVNYGGQPWIPTKNPMGGQEVF